ncbi:HIT family protein [Cellulomonas carbonis]|uniref:HIT family protein n=1 Tax=Cellulomonas carbonis TaxID=1386092 RepID=UPI000AC72EFE|nr:hydrolase [Cellulomonas carbonis]
MPEDPTADVTGAAGVPTTVPAGDLAGVPDGFGRLWTPHRMAYIGGQDKPADDGSGACPFCRAGASSDDAEALVVARGTYAFVVLNLYPYNSGHAMVVPFRHVADYTELTHAETVEVADLTRTTMQVLRAVMGPQGFNLGMNQGAVAGAGIAAHLHQHVVPRWAGDSNFLPIVGRTKAMPELLADTRRRLADAWPIDAHGPEGLTGR